jgi:hypothetical protein
MSDLGLKARSPHARLDQRILDPGIKVTVWDLAAAFADHYPAEKDTACKSCGHRYDDSRICPTLAVVVPLLKRRRHEDFSAVPEWVREVLQSLKPVRIPEARSAEPPEPEGLFDGAPYSRPKIKASRRTKRPPA